MQNHSAAALGRKTLPHVARGGLRYVEDAGEIHGDDLVPFFGSDFEEAVADADAGVVDEHIDAAHGADRFGERGFYLHQVGDVGDDGFGDCRQLVTKGGAGCGIAVEDADLRTFFEKTRGGGGADSAGASGDQDSFVFQASHGARAFSASRRLYSTQSFLQMGLPRKK